MIVQCSNCHTKFNLDEANVRPEGSWVRCSNCSEVFEVFPPNSDDKKSEGAITLDVGLMDDDKPQDSDFDLDLDLSSESEPSSLSKFFKVFFWIIASILLLAMLFLGALIAMDRLQMAPDFVDKCRSIPGISLLLQHGADSANGQEKNGEIQMDLENVRGVFRINQHSGRLFVIQGLIRNKRQHTRTDVLVHGRLFDSNQKVVREAVVYAGPVFTPEQLRDLSIKDIQARLGNPIGSDGSRYVVEQEGTIPFMIVFANLPQNTQEFTAAVVGSEPLESKPQTK